MYNCIDFTLDLLFVVFEIYFIHLVNKNINTDCFCQLQAKTTFEFIFEKSSKRSSKLKIEVIKTVRLVDSLLFIVELLFLFVIIVLK